MSTHRAEAERLLSRVKMYQGKVTGAFESDTIALAQVHATLALAEVANSPDAQPGPCPVNSPSLIGYPDGLTCVGQAGHAGLHNRSDTRWTTAEGHELTSVFEGGVA